MSDKYGESCPCCGTEWKITTFGVKVWKDCLKCDDTAENLVAKASKNNKECPVSAENKHEGADWLGYDYGPWPQSYGMPVNKDADQDDVGDWGDLPF